MTSAESRHAVRTETLLIERHEDGSWAASGPKSLTLGRAGEQIQNPEGKVGGWSTAAADWSWNGRAAVVRTSRPGFLPLFYASTEDFFGVSTDLIALWKACPEVDLDDGALAVFLRSGTFIGDDTPFRQIRAVPPDSIVEWRDGEVRIERGRMVRTAPSNPPGRRRALVEFGERLVHALRNILEGTDDGRRLVLPLSGGRDSRHVLLALMELGVRPDCCVTMRHYPPKPDEDARVARLVSERLELSHRVIDRAPDRFSAELRKNQLTYFCADEHAWILPLTDHVASGPPARMFDGLGGDVLAAGLFVTRDRLDLLHSGRLDALADDLLGGDGYLPDLLGKDAATRWNRERALERVRAELERHLAAANPVGSYFLWNRTRREIALSTWSILGRAGPVHAPYLSAELFDFLTSLPAHDLADGRFHTDAIEHRYPHLRDLPFENPSVGPTALTRTERFRYARKSALMFLHPSKPRWVRSGFVLPRILLGLMSSRYGTLLPEILKNAIYLRQLGAGPPGPCTSSRAF